MNINRCGSHYREAMAFLTSREDHERGPQTDAKAFHLASMQELLSRLDNPQNVFPAVHIAGTKGKGSTATMLAAICSASGYRVGLYTSPHLDAVEERFVIDGQPVRPTELADLLLELQPIVEAMDREPNVVGPTYFEVATAVAMLYFARRKVDLAILEVGMGGRLDSTNICRPAVTVITSVSLDHTRELGDTLSQIANEKAGIIKQGVPVVSGVTEEAARHVIASRVAACAAPLLEMDRDFGVVAYTAPIGNELHATFDYKARQSSLKSRTGMQLGLLGRHQAQNAALALTTLDLLSADGWKWDDRVVRRALAEVRCRGRVELISRNPFLVIDAAHNVASIRALLDTLEEIAFGDSQILLFSSSVDKDLEGMLRLLLPRFDHVILTRYPGSSRAADPHHLAEIVQQINTKSGREGITWEVQHDPNAAWNVARDRLAGGGAVCVTGSFFIAAHLRRLAQQADLSAAAHRSQCHQKSGNQKPSGQKPSGQRAVRLGT